MISEKERKIPSLRFIYRHIFILPPPAKKTVTEFLSFYLLFHTQISLSKTVISSFHQTGSNNSYTNTKTVFLTKKAVTLVKYIFT